MFSHGSQVAAAKVPVEGNGNGKQQGAARERGSEVINSNQEAVVRVIGECNHMANRVAAKFYGACKIRGMRSSQGRAGSRSAQAKGCGEGNPGGLEHTDRHLTEGGSQRVESPGGWGGLF